ncbi:regulatory protein GemA [Bradyrhizobium sp. 31Argb]|uniref:regulatory protein GemA n=1 Tax=Bradyrhizobium sp. 31Argb TaxID=3141247 RepID=UPI0037490EC1
MRLTERPATTSMIATIHTLKPKAGLGDDETYRDFLQSVAGVRSSKELSVATAPRVIEKMRELAGGAGAAKGSVVGLDGPIGTKLRALWISGYNLGIVRDRSDHAMLSFLQRQTDVSHVRFLKDARAGSSAIEGLKSWLGRTGNVEWPTDSDDVIGSKRAVLYAQWRRLIEIGAVKPIGSAVDPMEDLQHYAGRIVRQNRWETFKSADYDEVQKALGRKLRAALAQHTGDAQ